MENPHLELWGFLALLTCTEKTRISQAYDDFLGVRLCVENPSRWVGWGSLQTACCCRHSGWGKQVLGLKWQRFKAELSILALQPWTCYSSFLSLICIRSKTRITVLTNAKLYDTESISPPAFYQPRISESWKFSIWGDEELCTDRRLSVHCIFCGPCIQLERCIHCLWFWKCVCMHPFLRLAERRLHVGVISPVSWKRKQQKFDKVCVMLRITEFCHQVNPESQPHKGVCTPTPAVKQKNKRALGFPCREKV